MKQGLHSVWWFSVNLMGEDSDVCLHLEINWIYGVLFHFLSIVHKLHGYFKKEVEHASQEKALLIYCLELLGKSTRIYSP